MKILYEPQDFIIKQDDYLEKIIEDLDNMKDEEIRPVIKILVQQYRAMNYRLNIAENENKVLKAQWKLRKLEEQIDSEGGTISLLKDRQRWQIKGFSDDLINRIHQILYSRP